MEIAYKYFEDLTWRKGKLFNIFLTIFSFSCLNFNSTIIKLFEIFVLFGLRILEQFKHDKSLSIVSLMFFAKVCSKYSLLYPTNIISFKIRWDNSEILDNSFLSSFFKKILCSIIELFLLEDFLEKKILSL